MRDCVRVCACVRARVSVCVWGGGCVRACECVCVWGGGGGAGCVRASVCVCVCVVVVVGGLCVVKVWVDGCRMFECLQYLSFFPSFVCHDIVVVGYVQRRELVSFYMV